MLSGTSLSADPGLVAKAIAEATDDVIFAKGLDGRYQFANPAMLAVVEETVKGEALAPLGEGGMG